MCATYGVGWLEWWLCYAAVEGKADDDNDNDYDGCLSVSENIRWGIDIASEDDQDQHIVVPWMPEVRAGSDREKWGDIRNENCYVQSCLCNRWRREHVWSECKVLPDYSIIFIVIIASVEKECKNCWWMVKYRQATVFTSDYRVWCGWRWKVILSDRRSIVRSFASVVDDKSSDMTRARQKCLF